MWHTKLGPKVLAVILTYLILYLYCIFTYPILSLGAWNWLRICLCRLWKQVCHLQLIRGLTPHLFKPLQTQMAKTWTLKLERSTGTAVCWNASLSHGCMLPSTDAMLRLEDEFTSTVRVAHSWDPLQIPFLKNQICLLCSTDHWIALSCQSSCQACLTTEPMYASMRWMSRLTLWNASPT